MDVILDQKLAGSCQSTRRSRRNLGSAVFIQLCLMLLFAIAPMSAMAGNPSIENGLVQISVDELGRPTVAVKAFNAQEPADPFVAQYVNGNDWGNLVWLTDNATTHSSGYLTGIDAMTAVSNVSLVGPGFQQIITVTNLGATDIQLTQTITLVVGSREINFTWKLINNHVTETYTDLRFFHGGNASFGGNANANSVYFDKGGFLNLSNSALSGWGRMGLQGVSGFWFDRYFAGAYTVGNNAAQDLGILPNTDDETLQNAGLYMQWNLAALAPEAEWEIRANQVWTEPEAASTTTTIESISPNTSSVSGQTVAVTIRVLGDAPTGVVTVQAYDENDDEVSSCEATLTSAPTQSDGSCSFASPAFKAEDLIAYFSASYAGDESNGSSSSGDAAYTVNKGNVGASAMFSKTAVVVGEPVTVSVGLSATLPATGTVGGDGSNAVDFIVNANDGTNCSFDLDAAQSSCVITFASAGNFSRSVNQVLNASGKTVNAVTAAKTITGAYQGSANFNDTIASPSDFGSISVSSAATATTLTTAGTPSGLNPSVFGETIRLTATVVALAPSTATPAGTVQFTEGSTVLGTAVVDESGIATFDVSSASVGDHQYYAFFLSNDEFIGSDDNKSHAVGKSNTQTTIHSFNPASNVMQALENVTVNASVAAIIPGSGTPSGTIQIRGDDTAGCDIALSGGNTCVLSFSSKGAKDIVATYTGDSSFNASGENSDEEVVTVLGIATTLNLPADPPQTSYYGNNFEVPYTLTGGNGTFDGTVTIFANIGIPVGAARSGYFCEVIDADGTGSCEVNASSADAGLYNLSANYAGDETDLPASFNGPRTHNILQAVTELSISSSTASPVQVGDVLTIDLALSVTSGQGYPPGTITVSGVNTTGCSVILNGLINDPTSCDLSFTAVGAAQALSASYVSNSGNFANANSNDLLFTVDKADTELSIDSFVPISGTSTLGEGVTVHFTVSGGYGDFDGAVTINVARPGASSIACSPVNFDEGDGDGSCSVSGVDIQFAGDYTFTVSYAGDIDDAASSDEADYSVIKRDSRTELSTNPGSPQQAGQAFDFHLNVRPFDFCRDNEPNCRGTTPPAVASGDVLICDITTIGRGEPTICDAQNAVCVVSLNGNGDGSCGGITLLNTGTYWYEARYQGDNNFNSSTSSSVQMIIVVADTSITITNSLATATVVGQDVLVQFDVDGGANNPDEPGVSGATPNGGTPRYAGEVTVNATLASPVASASCGPVSVNTETGVGSCTIQGVSGFLRAGTWSVTASYNGDANDAASDSAAANHPVNAANTASTLVSGPTDPTPFGAPFELVSTVTAVEPSSATPTGDVEFFSGAVSLGIRPLNGSGVATLTGLSRPAGTHNFRSVFLANPDFLSSVVITEAHVVGKASVVLELQAAPVSPSLAGVSVTITGTVTTQPLGAGVPTGTLAISASGPASLSCNTAALSGSGNQSTAGCALNFTVPGTYNVQATYANADGNFNSLIEPTGDLEHVVNKVPTTLTIGTIAPVSPALVGQTVTVPFTLTGGYADNDGTITVSTTPAGPSCVDVSVASATCDLVFAQPGTYSINAAYTGDVDDESSQDSQADYVVDHAAPTISSIDNQVVLEDSTPAALAFTVGDDATPVADLTATASSSNQTIVPDASLTLGGSAENRTVQFTPAANQFGGPVTITVRVTDAQGKFSEGTFDVTVTGVNDQPSFTIQGNQIHIPGSSGVRTATDFVQSVNLGPFEAATQAVQQYTVVEVSDPSSVVSGISISTAGVLTYTLSGAGGSAEISATLQDNGGTDNGGVDTSVALNFLIIVGSSADLLVSKSNNENAVVLGRDTIYQIVIENLGPDSVTGVRLIDNVAAQLSNAQWSCESIVNASCPVVSTGTGSIDQLLNIPFGGSLRFNLVANVSSSQNGFVSNTATLQVPLTVIDPNMDNNSATDTDPVLGDGIFSDGFETGTNVSQHQSPEAKAATK